MYSVSARQARKKNELIPISSTERNRIPSFGRPMMTKTKMISSGVLRTSVMYVVAAFDRNATGPTRIAASSVPSTSDSAPETRNSPMVSRNALR